VIELQSQPRQRLRIGLRVLADHFQRHFAALQVARPVSLAHASFSEARDDLVRSDLSPTRQRHARAPFPAATLLRRGGDPQTAGKKALFSEDLFQKQEGSGEGTLVPKRFALQQLPSPDPSQTRSPMNASRNVPVGAVALPVTEFATMWLPSGFG